MRHLAFPLLVAALCGLFVAAASAARPLGDGNDPLQLTTQDVPGSAGFVEQQSPGGSNWMVMCNADPSTCVVNPTPCLWTVDSRVTYMGLGVLAAGASVSATPCLVADTVQHILGLRVTGGSPDLNVSAYYEAYGFTFDFIPRAVSSDYEYRGCVVGPYYGDLGPLPPVADSNGGVGARTDITVTITNPTGRKVRNVAAQFVIGSSEPARQAQFCQGELSEAYPAAGAIWKDAL